MQTMRSIVSGREPSALIQNEVLALNDEERIALLQKAGISPWLLEEVHLVSTI